VTLNANDILRGEIMDEIYKMKLHDVIALNINQETIQVIRVPGGWIYQIYNQIHHSDGDSEGFNFVFVPYHSPSEFKRK